MKRRYKDWILIGTIVVLAAFLFPWRAAADKIGVLVGGTYYLDIAGIPLASTTVTVANEATDTTCFPLFVTSSAGGVLGPKSNAGFTFNSNTGAFGATTATFGGAASLLLGTAGSAVGSVGLRNATSGTVTIQPITGALGTPTLVIGTTYTDARWCSYATATGFTCNETAPQAASATLTSLAGLTETNGGIPYGTGDNAYAWLAAGTANYLLQANGAAAPSWVTNVTLGTVSAGAGGATIDSDGDVVAKSLSVTRTNSPDYFRVYEATSDGDLYSEWAAPALGTGFTATTSYKFPVAAPAGGQCMAFPTPTAGASQGVWVLPISTSLATNAVDAANSIWAISNGIMFEGATANDFETFLTVSDVTADRTITLPDATGTVQLTTKTVVDGSAALVLTAAQVSGTVISNTGQGVNDINHTLPAAAAGYTFRALVGEAQAAKYWRFTRAGTDTVCLDGTCDKTYVSIAAPTRGATLDCNTLQIASTGIKTTAALAMGSTKDKVANGAFTYDAAGAGYAEAADAVGTELNAVTTPQNKYGAQALDIGADGTVDPISCTNIATGFDTALEAVADLPAAAAGHARMGYVTAMDTAVAGFIWGTTEFDSATVTEAFTSSAAYTKPYAWVCNTLTGTWSTD